AEDGIRDGHVTGVQTCALPICHRIDFTRKGDPVTPAVPVVLHALNPSEPEALATDVRPVANASGSDRMPNRLDLARWLVDRKNRSEERRVGKSVDVGGSRMCKK